ncbi:MAG: LysR family transcriptional regulator [Pseudomonadales bacterium]|uniref:LysR family transcriptional regulator n=1 Tax=Alcanivorax profundi TaxID=2338368 RepID=A0A418Y0A7_9GAMM|nr:MULTISPECIES: LysR family transcriptional regulator [Alcanivorax]MCG8439813.1 LysR family transcriptional regulator [Pseudomonadales bacterium]MED5432614.1 LysR family transcriptional regulator [Pseudomonadota bacterium]ERP90088.1 LysR family transcriptional regulator [Alcanivorax sp. P2S70]MEE2869611.1 LysR family transcriptional regulator [Pseudomonadota bacterium]PNE02348.1 LysR family transcriptional regulator [Alcanivorax sp. MD8A]|tara:strand:- start:1800 stop:2669 length:870 start_codon:yes stop_codon:yes gene_type:complete
MQHWDRIEAFVEVVRRGSFAHAARHLGVSSSHVSRLVARLETQLGTQLLYRTTRRLTLTDAGQVYFEHCGQLFDGFQEALAAISDFQQSPTGVLKLTCATTFGERFIAPLVNDFLDRHPQLSVQLDFTNRRVDIVDEGFDVAIRTGALPDSSLIARKLCARREYVVGSAGYFQRHARPHTLGELGRHNCLRGSASQWSFDVDGQHRHLKVQGNWQGNSGVALLDAARKGLGLVQLPDYYVEADLESGALVSVLDQYACTHTAVWVVYPRHRHLSPKVRQFVDFLVASFA